MNKLDFLRRLNIELGILDNEEKKEILAFYEERFYSGTIYENKTEEEVISELESPEVIARNVLSEYGVSPKYVKTKEERYSGINPTKLILLIIFDLLVVSWLLPTLYSVTVSLFSSMMSYVGVVGLIIGTHTIADEFMFAFATGGYILLFIFGLLILEVSIFVTKKILIYHTNVLKIKNREKYSRQLHKISVEGWFKRHKRVNNLKTIMFVGAIVVMIYSGYHLFIKDERLINDFLNQYDQVLITDIYTEDFSDDIVALESWNIVTDLESSNVQIVPTLGTELTVTHNYYEDYDYELVVDPNTNTVTITNNVPTSISWNFESIFFLFRDAEEVIIEVPVDLLINDIDVKVINGTVKIMDIEATQIDIDTANGKITLDEITIGSNVTLYTSNGEINIQNVIGTYDLNATTSNGRIYIRNTEFLNYNLETSNGAINLANLNVVNQDGVSLDAKTSNGSIILEDVYILDVILDTSNGDIEFFNSDLTYIVEDLETDTSLGNISTNVD